MEVTFWMIPVMEGSWWLMKMDGKAMDCDDLVDVMRRVLTITPAPTRFRSLIWSFLAV